MYSAIHSPPTPTNATPNHTIVKKPTLGSEGMTCHSTSNARIAKIQPAIVASLCRLRLFERDSSTRNGSAKCASTSSVEYRLHRPCVRFRYHGTSSGRLPDQVIRNCDKVM